MLLATFANPPHSAAPGPRKINDFVGWLKKREVWAVDAFYWRIESGKVSFNTLNIALWIRGLPASTLPLCR